MNVIPSLPIYMLRVIAGREGWSPERLLSLLDPEAELPEPKGKGKCRVCGLEDYLIEKRSPNFVDHYYLPPREGRRAEYGEAVLVCPYCAVMFSGSKNKLTRAKFLLIAEGRLNVEGNLAENSTLILTNRREEFQGALEKLFDLRGSLYFAAVRVGGPVSRDYPLLKAKSLRKVGDLIWVWFGSTEFPISPGEVGDFLDMLAGVLL